MDTDDHDRYQSLFFLQLQIVQNSNEVAVNGILRDTRIYRNFLEPQSHLVGCLSLADLTNKEDKRQISAEKSWIQATSATLALPG